jgi:outer membrane immunogenic protein
MRKNFFGAIAFVAILGAAAVTVANAADMAVKAPPAPVVTAYNWTGFYLGIEGGGGWGSTSHTNEVSGIGSGVDHHLDGGLFGGTYGYNWQLGSWLLGLEGDISWSGIKDTYNSNNGTGFCSPAGANCVTNLRWFGTDRARIGFTWDRFLVYGTGGFAYGSVNASITNPCCDSETHTRIGYAAGAGIEAMFAPNWSAKLEYLYVDLGNHRNYNLITTVPPDGESVLVRFNSVRAGIDYHFNSFATK